MSWIQRIGLPLALAAVFSLAGGHWLVLQGVAWAEMAVEYSQDRGILAGLEKTFSGKSPCKLCLKVQKGSQQEEQKPALLKAGKKAEILLCASPLAGMIPPQAPFSYPPAAFLPPVSHRESPPSPVPLLPLC